MAGWTLDELRDLRELFASTPDEELVRRFRRPLEEIHAQAQALALAKNKARFKGVRKMPRWDAEALERLRELYPHRPNREIARELGRSAKAIASKASKLGLQKSPERIAAMGRENRELRRPRGPALDDAPGE